MKKIHQVPIGIEAQVKNLKDLGLSIEDEIYAKKVLKKISYYRLIKAYGITLKKDGRYMEGISFDDIVALYSFDQEFRQLLFSMIEEIEVSLRAAITNYFSLKYENFGYEDIDNFEKRNEQKRVIQELKKEVKRNNRSPFIKNFVENYEGGGRFRFMLSLKLLALELYRRCIKI